MILPIWGMYFAETLLVRCLKKFPWDIYLNAKKEIKFAFIEELNYIFLYSESLS